MQLIDDREVVARNVLNSFIESCVWGMSQSDVQTVDQAIATFSLSVEITSMFSASIAALLNRLFVIVCPGQPTCSERGSCINGLCVCEAGIIFFSSIPLLCLFLSFTIIAINGIRYVCHVTLCHVS